MMQGSSCINPQMKKKKKTSTHLKVERDEMELAAVQQHHHYRAGVVYKGTKDLPSSLHNATALQITQRPALPCQPDEMKNNLCHGLKSESILQRSTTNNKSMSFWPTTISYVCAPARKDSDPSSSASLKKRPLALHLNMLISTMLRKRSADDCRNYRSVLGENRGVLSVTRERHRSVCDNKGSRAYPRVIKAQSAGQSLVNELGER